MADLRGGDVSCCLFWGEGTSLRCVRRNPLSLINFPLAMRMWYEGLNTWINIKVYGTGNNFLRDISTMHLPS